MGKKVNPMKKKGQIAVWVIIALALVVSIVLFFVLSGNTQRPTSTQTPETTPGTSIQSCASKAVTDALQIMLPQGGFLNATNAETYNGENISYLCLNTGNYHPCINQHPMFLNEMEGQIRQYVAPRLEQCFATYKTAAENENEQVTFGPTNLSVSMAPDRVFLDIKKTITVKKNGVVTRINDTKVTIVSPVYNLGEVAMEIANQQAKYCSFQTLGYMILHPRFDIKVHVMDDSTKIYSIEDTRSQETLNIAIRSCAIPPGI